jgi:amino acid transporter
MSEHTDGDLSLTPARDFTLWSGFALSFSNISPIVGIYSVFALGLAIAGPAFFWALPLVLIGQLLVSGVFGDLVSRWPYQGSVYAWSRMLVGRKYGWLTNWAYIWGLVIAMAAVALSAAGNLAGAFGDTAPTQHTTIAVAIGVLAFGTLANILGATFLKYLFYLSLTAEIVSSAGIGIALLGFHRLHSFSIIFSAMGTGHGASWLVTPFLGVVAFTGFSFLGFESSAAIAEEVQESRHVLPKAIVLSLAAAGALVIFAALGLVLAVPDMGAVLAGQDTNPIATTLTTDLGSGIGRVLLVMLSIGFTASMIAVQTAVSRSIWASARAHEFPLSPVFSKLSGKERLPYNALILTAVVAGALLFINTTKAYLLLLNFSSAGFYLSYLMPVVAAVWVRSRGRWQPGPVSMGRLAGPVTTVAAIWIVAEVINIAWPRNAYAGDWVLNWGILWMSAVVGLIGIAIMTYLFRPGSPANTEDRTPDVDDLVGA